MTRAVTKVTFPGAGGDELAGRLDLPEGAPRAFALFAHCFTCGKDIAAASRISSGLVAAGFAVLRFDFTGLGSSEGEFANTTFTSNVADLVGAAAMLRDRYEPPALLVGHSLGGAAVLGAAPQIPEVLAVATIAAPMGPAHAAGLITAEERRRIERDGEAEVLLAGRSFRLRREFLEDISAHRLNGAVGRLGAALLVLHSPVDQLVGVDHARAIFDAARHPKSFVALDGADHLLSDRADAAYVAGLLAAWSAHYLPATGPNAGPGTEPESAPESSPEPAEGSTTGPAHGVGTEAVEAVEAVDGVVVEPDGPAGFTQRVRSGRHTLLADEPVGVGQDLGPTPYDLLLAGLGACTSMTLRLYAQRRQIPLDHVRVTLRHERTHAEDCAGADGRPCTIEHIDRQIELHGDLTEAQRAELARMADRCPVHRTLVGEIRVSTAIVPGPDL